MNGRLGVGFTGLGFIAKEWPIVVAADFNGDGKTDILWQNTVTGERYLRFVNRTATLSHASLGTEAVDWRIVN